MLLCTVYQDTTVDLCTITARPHLVTGEDAGYPVGNLDDIKVDFVH